MDILFDIATDALMDALKLLPFLFVTYLFIEYLEHKTGDKTHHMIEKSGHFGPIIGALFGVFPQCGFSAAASNLYAGRVITLGTLISIYLSTSDEMLPILISEQAPVITIVKILAVKVIVGMVAGILIDFVHRTLHENEKEPMDIHHLCEHEHCKCETKGILYSAVHHSLEIFAYILVVNFALNLLLTWIGEDALQTFLLNRPVIGELAAGLIGLIPNCVASVVLTQLYLEGVLSAGRMITGLLVSSGVGLFVLFRVNDKKQENWKILGILYAVGVISGLLFELLGITF